MSNEYKVIIMDEKDLLARTIDKQQLEKLNAILSELKAIKLAVAQPDTPTIIQPSPISDYELGRRMGSIMTLDNQGEVFWFDDFESSTLKWNVTYATTGSHTASLDYAHSYDQSWKLVDDGNDSDVRISKPFPYRNKTRMGFEASIMPDTTNTPTQINVGLYFFDGVNVHQGVLKFYLTAGQSGTGTVQLMGANNDVIIASPGIPYNVFHNWISLKVVIDYNEGVTGSKRYIRAIINDQEIDISSYSMYSEASALAKHIEARLYCVGAAAGSAVAYVDDAIVTVNEP